MKCHRFRNFEIGKALVLTVRVNLEIAEDMSYNHMVEAFSGMPASWIEKREFNLGRM